LERYSCHSNFRFLGAGEFQYALDAFSAAPFSSLTLVGTVLVDDDVVEPVQAEPAQVVRLSEGLDRGEEDVGGRVFLLSGVEAEVGFGADGAEGVEGLAEDLLAVGDEEDALRLEAVGVEGGKPRLSESGGEDDEYRSN
jgi:hypothetical protein